MANFEQLKRTFFDECSELLQQTEAGLTDIREGHNVDDAVNAVFRAVHSVKGGAGVFGFEPLVEFAHIFETVLDAVRRGTLAATSEVIDVLLMASDVLTDLVQMSRTGEIIAPDFGKDCRAALQQLMERGPGETGGGAAEVEDNSPAPAEFEGLDFTPVRAEQFDDGNSGVRSYSISFVPKPEMLQKGCDPLHILRELRKLGELELVADTDTLPPLSELQIDRPYISWKGTLRTAASRADIEGLFAVAGQDCEFAIEDLDALPPLSAGDGAAPAEEAAPVTPTAASPTSPTSPSTAPVAERPAEQPAPVSRSSAESGTRPAAAKPTATTTRIELEKIDRVVNMVGELVIAQAMLGQIVQDLPEHISSRFLQILDEVVHHTRELKDSVMSMRAQPVSAVFQRMPRLVRELSAKTGKKVRLEMFGETTEVDRSIIERLGDPLTHIIRNSVDHGIEAPADRLAAGKPEEGVIRLAAEHRGGRIVIEISDDGAGINPERVLKKAREKGLVAENATLTEDEINNLIMLPGFSTAETISDISGRGVGMDVVRNNIQDIGGRITLKSERGRGVTIQLALPLTLAVMDGMVIKVGQETYVMPMSAIVECLRPSRADINNLIGTRGMLKLRGNLLPLVSLADLLAIEASASKGQDRVVIVTEAGDERPFGVIVDELCGHQQVVIKSIEESYGSVPGIAAATILGNGRVAFILDVEKLSELAATIFLPATHTAHEASAAQAA
ncbi:MAG TPA: chemotaxis protein CheA [Xanthobacteraceae bacterium]|nr:chemotaxis protein CheA [Xanthobacteraceae bacterium]